MVYKKVPQRIAKIPKGRVKAIWTFSKKKEIFSLMASLNESDNDWGDCRTAPATPGLLVSKSVTCVLLEMHISKGSDRKENIYVYKLSILSETMINLTKQGWYNFSTGNSSYFKVAQTYN